MIQHVISKSSFWDIQAINVQINTIVIAIWKESGLAVPVATNTWLSGTRPQGFALFHA